MIPFVAGGERGLAYRAYPCSHDRVSKCKNLWFTRYVCVCVCVCAGQSGTDPVYRHVLFCLGIFRFGFYFIFFFKPAEVLRAASGVRCAGKGRGWDVACLLLSGNLTLENSAPLKNTGNRNVKSPYYRFLLDILVHCLYTKLHVLCCTIRHHHHPSAG